jgi:carboxypeptidase Taq
MNTSELYNSYKTKMQKIADVKYASAVLQWDQETYLPPKGNHYRGRQIATLAEIAHEQFTDEHLGNILTDLMAADNLAVTEKRNVQLTFEDYNRNKKLSPEFVRKMSEAVNRSFHAWIEARKKNSFEIFVQPLQQVIELKKQEADYLGYADHPYNALINDYDKGLTVNITDDIFKNLLPSLSELINTIKNKPQVNDDFLYLHYPKDDQWKFGTELLSRIGFDWKAGRQDISEHPFTINFNNADVRVTTRIDENDLSNMTWSCLHEGGHALYEQGLPAEQYGLPLGEYCSLSIHESQRRLWENCIGRSLPFWEHNFALAKSFFNTQLATVTVEDFYKAINKVQPSLIRTEADELTYHFHVYIRYEIEKELIKGTLQTKDIPLYWNDMYKKYLDITVPDDKTGCLQDVHWSHGSLGYFATYSIGSLYASQLHAAICAENKLTDNEIKHGNTNGALSWLREKIHLHGRKYTSQELCNTATGQYLNSVHFINYTFKKYTTIYNL